MRTIGKTIIVHRGETFKLKRAVYKEDGVTPYVLSMNVENPYLIITVSSNNYKVDGKYKLNSWLDLSSYPSFRRTNAEYLAISYITPISPNYNDLPYGYNSDGKDCIFYTQDSYGNKEYWYYDGSVYKEYDFTFSKQFLNIHTSQWIESQYLYEFRIVGGKRTDEYLSSLYDSVYPDRTYKPSGNFELYKEIKKCNPELVKGIRPSAPLVNFSTQDILQKPEIIIVKSNC